MPAVSSKKHKKKRNLQDQGKFLYNDREVFVRKNVY